jgi:hypothetical protein
MHTPRILFAAAALVAAPLLFACEPEPTCDPGDLPAAYQSAPLASAIPTGEDVTVCKKTDGETHARFWRPVEVHRANMDSVRQAQDNGWTRLDDNWYGSTDSSDRPKWSELQNKDGKLRIDIKKAGGGAQIDYRFTPGQ